jgi:hypothetical protein
MLHSSPPSPSTGALRLLRWLALYGSFGTAAGATAFVLEEQRRQICRLSRIRDNGKKLKEFIHRRNLVKASSPARTPASSLPDFHDYVQDLETKGLVRREPVTQSGKAGMIRDQQDEFHYEMKARILPAVKSPIHGSNAGKQQNDSSEVLVGGNWRMHPSTRIRRLPHRKSDSMQSPKSFPSFRRIKNIQPTKPVYSPGIAQHKKALLEHRATKRKDGPLDREETCQAIELLISERNAQVDIGELEDFLSIAARAKDFNTIGRLLDACEAELPWSAHLYPCFLRSLMVAGVNASSDLSIANSMFLLGQRVFEKSGIDPTPKIKSFYRANAFPLVLAAYQNYPDHAWDTDTMTILLECALRMTALGDERSKLLTKILDQVPKNGHFFFKSFPQLKPDLSISHSQCQNKSSSMLDMLDKIVNRKDLVIQLLGRGLRLFLSDQTLQRCCAALIQESTQDEIVEVLHVIQMESESMSRTRLERARAALLRQTWRCTHNFNQVQALFEHIDKFRDLDSKRIESGILSSTMIAICAKARRWEEAKHYVWDARHLSPEAKRQLSQAGQYYMTLLRARQGQWELVKEDLCSASICKNMEGREELFLEVFGIFSQQHEALKAFEFFKWCMGPGGASPTQAMFDILISNCLADGNGRLSGQILGFMSEIQFQWQIRAETVVMSFRKYANRYKPNSVPLMQCIEGLRDHPNLLSKDVCLVLMERCSVAARRLRVASKERLHLMQKRGQETLIEQIAQLESLASTVPWISQQRNMRSERLDNPLLERAQAYYIRMQVASSLHHWEEVISIFQESNQQSIPRLELSLSLAVTACLKMHDPSSGFNLIQDARKVGFVTRKAEVVMSQCGLADPANNAKNLRTRVFQHYEHLVRQHLPLDHGMLVQAAQILVLRSQPAASVALLSEVYQSSFAELKPFDIVVMTSFLTAYSGVLDIDGIRWTIQTILAKNLLLDTHFFRALTQARFRVSHSLLRDSQKKRSQEIFHLFRIWDTICWRRYETQQRQVLITGRVMTNMLVRLYMKDVSPRQLTREALEWKSISCAEFPTPVTGCALENTCL